MLHVHSQVVLREPVITPDSDITLWFMVFGGGHQAYFYKPCSDFSLRIRLDIRCSVKPCTHTFGEWEVETMPGHRCMLDTAVLPNGKVVILGGTEEGLSNLDYRPNRCVRVPAGQRGSYPAQPHADSFVHCCWLHAATMCHPTSPGELVCCRHQPLPAGCTCQLQR